MSTVPAIGIDLGTTYSCVGVFRNGKVEIIAKEATDHFTSSCVAFTDTERFIGDDAKDQVAMNPKNTVFDAKRLIGRKFDDPCVQSDMKHWPFTVVSDAGKPKIQVVRKNEPKTFSPEEISAMVLMKLKESAESFLGETITEAVISVPASFKYSQRQATRDAGTIAGLNVLRIINEPTAAALAYGLDKEREEKHNVLIFDLGGGTFDVSVVRVENDIFKVLSTAGDAHLGGKDFDNRLVAYFMEEFKARYYVDMADDERSVCRLLTACERAKRTMSKYTQALIDIDSLYDGVDFHSAITRAVFEKLCADLFDRTLELTEEALRSANIDKGAIDEIVLVGGSTRIPKIRKLLRDFFDGKEFNETMHPDEAVARGAAVQAAILHGREIGLLEFWVVLDVAPWSLWIQRNCGMMTRMVKRNTTLPFHSKRGITIFSDSRVLMKAFEGESASAEDNDFLGTIELVGVPRIRRGIFLVDITAYVDDDGRFTIVLSEKYTGRVNAVTFTNTNARLDEDTVDEVAEAVSKMDIREELKKNGRPGELRGAGDELWVFDEDVD